MNKLTPILIITIVMTSAVAFYAFTNKDSKQNNSPITQNTDTQELPVSSDRSGGGVVSDPLPLSSCNGRTAAVTEGPYFVSDTQLLANGQLNYDSLPGDTIKFVGYVYDGTDKSKPLPNAKIEIWQADSDGDYWPESNGLASKYSGEQLSLRGYVVTDSKGFYSYSTIYPGEYEGRARHIHLKVSAENQEPVVTQLIMSKPGDKTPASRDNIAQQLPDCNTPDFKEIDSIPTAAFDFYI